MIRGQLFDNYEIYLDEKNNQDTKKGTYNMSTGHITLLKLL